MRTIGNIFKERRSELKLTQQIVAEKAGVDRTTYLKIEKGIDNNPRLRTVLGVSRAMNMDLSYLNEVK